MNAKNKIRMISNDRVSGIDYVKDNINLCRLPSGLICIGCCGFDFANDLDNKEEFVKALLKSTKEFSDYSDTLSFKKRCENYELHDCGLCKQLIFKKNLEQTGDLIKNLTEIKKLNMTCALHPCENNGEEFREGECDLAYMCETQKMFLREWGEWTQKKFLKFVESKNLDWFTYSKTMHDNSLVKEFFDKGLVTNYDK